jgi:hypothetical protein
VRADGTFELAGVPRGPLAIAIVKYAAEPSDYDTHVDVQKDVDGVSIATQAMPPLYVIVRNTGMSPPDLALVFLYTGKPPAPHATIGSLNEKPSRQYEARLQARDTIPAVAREHMQADDMFAFVQVRPAGALYVCSLGVTRDMFAKTSTQDAIVKAMFDAEVGCAAVTSDLVVVVEIPPMRRPK